MAITCILGQFTDIIVLATVLTTRVVAYAWQAAEIKPSHAPPQAQLSVLHDTMWLVLVLILITFRLAFMAQWTEHHPSRQALPHSSDGNCLSPYGCIS